MTIVSIVADQVLYGWAENKGRSGYQFVTQSASLIEEDFDFLEKYSIPVGLNNTTFREGRRLLSLPSGKIAMNYIKNIGKDTHGRDGAVMSHFLVFDFKNFVEGRKNLEELDKHHLKGISYVKDIEKLKLPNGNFMKLPVVNIEIEINDQSYGEELISEKNKDFSKDVLYGLFLNVFQNQIKIGLISSDFNDLFKQAIIIESLFPPWLVLTYSTYDSHPSDEETIFDIICTPPSIENKSNVIINYTGRTVELPGEDSLIRSVANEYFRLIETGGVYEIGNSENLPQNKERNVLANFFISRIVNSICTNAEPSVAIKTALRVSKMGSYGSKDDYYKIVLDIITGSGFRDDLINAAVDYLKNDVETGNTKSISEGPLANLLPVLMQCEPGTSGGRNIVQYLKDLNSSNFPQLNEILIKSLLAKQSNVNMGITLFTAIPTLFKTWAKYSVGNEMSAAQIDKSILILKNFEIARKDLYNLVEEAIYANKLNDLDFLKEILLTISQNSEAFEQKKMFKLISQIQKSLAKRKILVPADLAHLIEELIGGEEEAGEEKRRFRLRG